MFQGNLDLKEINFNFVEIFNVILDYILIIIFKFNFFC